MALLQLREIQLIDYPCVPKLSGGCKIQSSWIIEIVPQFKTSEQVSCIRGLWLYISRDFSPG